MVNQAQAHAALQDLCMAQEHRARELEETNSLKEQQLLKLHARLEQVLSTLQVGQSVYADQQKELEEQKVVIAALRERATGDADELTAMRTRYGATSPMRSAASSASPSSPSSPARPPAPPTTPAVQGRNASAASHRLGSVHSNDQDDEADGDAEGEGEVDIQEMVELMKRAEELQSQLESLGQADVGSAVAQQATKAPARGLSAREQASAEAPSAAACMAEALAMQAAPELLQALSALSSEKARLESQLRGEQSALEAQLKDLHGQMAELETLEREAEPVD